MNQEQKIDVDSNRREQQQSRQSANEHHQQQPQMMMMNREDSVDDDAPATTSATATASSNNNNTNNSNLEVDETTAQEFSQMIGRVINLAHLVPSLSVACQKFQLEQAAAAVSYERLGPVARERAREQHFVEGLKRGFDFCLSAARAALTQAVTVGPPPGFSASKGGSSSNNGGDVGGSPISSSSDSQPTQHQEQQQQQQQKRSSSEESPQPVESSSATAMQLQMDGFAKIADEGGVAMFQNNNNNHQNLAEQRCASMPHLNSFNSCEEISGLHAAGGQINENLIQCIAELSHYSVQVMLQCFIVSRRSDIRRRMQEHAVLERRLLEYVRSGLATAREVECGWFAEGFRTSHMNLLCNAIFEAPVAVGRVALQLDGLVGLILFHTQHLDPENPGLNEWAAFTLRNLTQCVPEAGEYIQRLRNAAAASSSQSQARSGSAQSQ